VKVEIRITKPNSGGENSGSQWEDITVNGEEPKQELSVEAQISRLERRMGKHVAREEYEKAARLRDQIVKLKGEK
jgi:protein-arginine kinase activator protein McsA